VTASERRLPVIRRTCFLLLAVCVWDVGTHSLPVLADERTDSEAPVWVEAKRRTADKNWVKQKTETLEHVSGYAPGDQVDLTRFGGWTAIQGTATGFFHAERLSNQWWIIDPDGSVFLSIGVCSVRPNPTTSGQRDLRTLFGSTEGWARQTAQLLHNAGFNTLACWSAGEHFAKTAPRLAYTMQWNFMSSYGHRRGGVYQQPGHAGYPNDCIFVFDPEFETFCDEHARQLAATKNDPYLLGHFSDNEMPFRQNALDRYLQLKPTDPGHLAAQQWLRDSGKSSASLTDADREAFLEFAAARYFRIVGQAMKRYDPNHMYLGSRLHGSVLKQDAVFRACVPYVDVLSINWYHVWTPDREPMDRWLSLSGRPFLITEWYAKGMDSGMANSTGAGWTVKTQADRGRFYQNFTLGLLKHPGCVGWHWFKYMDNDPTNTRTDPSNRDSNKGIVTYRYKPWPPLLKAMTELNRQVYPLREHFQKQTIAPSVHD